MSSRSIRAVGEISKAIRVSKDLGPSPGTLRLHPARGGFSDVGRDLAAVDDPEQAEALLWMGILAWVQQILIED